MCFYGNNIRELPVRVRFLKLLDRFRNYEGSERVGEKAPLLCAFCFLCQMMRFRSQCFKMNYVIMFVHISHSFFWPFLRINSILYLYH